MHSNNQNPQNAAKNETIFAWATPPGRSGVAVLRFSGPNCSEVLTLLGVDALPKPRQATLTSLHHAEHGLIDQCLALHFPAPHSFTGEDCLELHTHGSNAVIQLLSRILLSCDFLRMAEPGEFAKRAFMHGKMDLIQAEGLADLIDADTILQHKQANALISGDITTTYEGIRAKIIEVRAHVEAYIDFPDEDIPEDTMLQMRHSIEKLIKDIESALDDGQVSEKIRSGIRVALIGPPNAGKSTLLNALAKREVAIISDEAGTTRDSLEVSMDVNGYPVTLVDTAGIRKTDSEVEKEGIRRSFVQASAADLVVGLWDASQNSQPDNDFIKTLGDNYLLYMTKADLLEAESLQKNVISLLKNSDINTIIQDIKSYLQQNYVAPASPLVVRERHREALYRCIGQLNRFLEAKENELLAEDLRLASLEIEKITGKIALDDILDVLFGTFCIGK